LNLFALVATNRCILLERRRHGEFVTNDEGKRQTQEMLARRRTEFHRQGDTGAQKEAEPAPTRADAIPRDQLQRFLSELARLGACYGVELEPDIGHGSMRLRPISPRQGGYAAERVDARFRVPTSYGHGVAFDHPTDDVVGDDMHPEAREERARIWREENAEAIAGQARIGPTRFSGQLPWNNDVD